MPRRAYSYLRYSHPSQRLGDSTRRQLDWAPRVAKGKGWLLDESAVIQDKGVSAFRGKNAETGALAAFLHDVRVGVVPRGSVLMVENLDRLSRQQLRPALRIFLDLLDSGISIMTREPERYYDAEGDPDPCDVFEAVMILSRGHDESQVKSFRGREAWKKLKVEMREELKPRGKRCPFWLEATAEGYKLRPGPAAAIKAMFEKAAAEMGCVKLAKWLNEHFPDAAASVKSNSVQSVVLSNKDIDLGTRPGRRRAARRGVAGELVRQELHGHWTLSTVHRILTGREVLGEYQPRVMGENSRPVPDGSPIPGYYPRLVDDDVWLRAQSAMHGRARKSGRPAAGLPNLFTGIVYHSAYSTTVCLISEGMESAGLRLRYLGLKKDKRLALGNPPATRWRYDQFEEAVLKTVEELSVRDVLPPGQEVDAREQRIGELTGKLVALDQRITMLKQVVENADAKEQDATDALEALASVRSQQKEVAEEQARLKMESDAGRGEGLAQTQTLIGLWREAQGTDEAVSLGERIRAALARIVESIWVVPQRLTRQAVILHTQIYLRSGVRRYVQILPPYPCSDALTWQLEGHDFRKGDIGDAAREAFALA